MRKSLIICFTLLSVVLCLGQKYNSIKFDTVNRNTSAKELFFKKIIERDHIVYEDEGKTYNVVEAFEKFKQTNDAVQYDLKTENEKGVKIIGKLYAIERYIDSETIFKYDNLSFNRFLIFSDTNDKTVAYKLLNDNQDETELNKFITKYTGLYKSSVNRDDDYIFELDNFTILLKKSNNNEVSPMSMGDPSPKSATESSAAEANKSEQQSALAAIEFIVIFKNLTSDLKNYLEENIYSQ